jgi:hypothetical protein
MPSLNAATLVAKEEQHATSGGKGGTVNKTIGNKTNGNNDWTN